MQVFISYAHTEHDSRIAHWLAGSLRRSGLAPWFDDSDTSPGDQIERELRAAIDRSDAALFLISRSWLERSWTVWELNQFAMRQPPCNRLVPVLCGPTSELQRLIPAYLTRSRHIEWPSNEADVPHAFWNIYCGIAGQKPGPREQWRAQAEALIGAPDAPPIERPRAVWDPAASRLHAGQARISLRCNRTRHWGLVETHAQEPRHEVLIVPGCRGQGHEHFMVRIEGELRRDPPRYVKILQWPRRPATQNDFVEMLAWQLDLDVGPGVDLRARVVQRLNTYLAHQNLILLHPPIRMDFLDEEIPTYYTKTLPELLGNARAAYHLKCVQPIEWRAPGSFRQMAARFARMMWPDAAEAGWIEEASEAADAEALMDRLKREASPHLRVVPFPMLGDVPDHEVLEFFERLGLPDAHKRRLLARVKSNSRTPEELFKAIDEYYPEFREAR